MRVKYILFDMGGVLFTNGTKDIAEFISIAYRIPVESVEARMKTFAPGLRLGKINLKSYWSLTFPDIKIDADKISGKWLGSYRIQTGLMEAAKRLSSTHAIGIQSTNFKERFEYPDAKYGLTNLFKHIFLSHNIGEMKPSKGFYEEIINSLGCPAGEILIVDDKEVNVESALSLGMQGFLLRNPEGIKELEADIRA